MVTGRGGVRRKLLWCLLGSALSMCPPRRADAQELEYQVKAQFLERFTRFVEWPDSVFPSRDSPFVLCVAGRPFGTYLDGMVRTTQIKDRTIYLRTILVPYQIEGCHLVFIAKSEQTTIGKLLDRTSNNPILTVGDTPGFAQRGILINFYLNKGQVRFEINLEAVRRSGLRFSSRLLALARHVPSKP